MKTMICLKSRFLLVMVALLCSVSSFAAALNLNQPFVLRNGGSDVWTFTATSTGIVKIAGATPDDYFGPCLGVYSDAKFKQQVDNFFYAPAHYEFQAETGKTYYIRNNNFCGQDIRAMLSMGSAFAFDYASPAEGGKLSVMQSDAIQLFFTSSSVSFSKGEVKAGGEVINVYNYKNYDALVANGTITYTEEGMSGVADWNGSVFARSENENGIVVSFTSATGHGYFNILNKLYEEGKLKEGDLVQLTIHDIRNSLTNELLNGDGELSLSWVFAGAPTALKSAKLPEVINSWFNAGDPAAIAEFTFSRDMKSAKADLEMGEGEGYEDLYTEDIADDHVTIEGNVVKVDLSGVMRTKSMMGLKYDWSNFRLRLSQVVDIDGNEAYSSDLGSASSYTFNVPFKDITGTLSSEFDPAPGSTLTAEDKEVEIWFNNSSLIEFDGVSILYYTVENVEDVDNEGNPVMTEQNVAHETFYKNEELDITVDEDGTTIICPLPEGIYKASNVCVKLNITKTMDGVAHDVVAYYNTSVAYELNLEQYAEPVNNSTVHRLAEVYLPLFSTYSICRAQNTPQVVVYDEENNVCNVASIEADGMTTCKIVLADPITKAGTYRVVIAKGMVGDYIYGESSYKSGIANPETELTYTVSGQWNGRDVVADPDDGETVNSLKTIKLMFFNYSAVAPTWNVEKAAYVEEVVSEDEKIRHEGAFVVKELASNELEFALDKEITADGQYRFVVTAGSVANGATGDPIEVEYVFNYTIGTVNVISKLFFANEAKADIYTVNGQLVKKAASADAVKTLAPGAYIINGKCVILK